MSKPKCKLSGKNGNIFNLISVATRTLKDNDMYEEANELKNRLLTKEEAESYPEALAIIGEYVEVY